MIDGKAIPLNASIASMREPSRENLNETWRHDSFSETSRRANYQRKNRHRDEAIRIGRSTDMPLDDKSRGDFVAKLKLSASEASGER